MAQTYALRIASDTHNQSGCPFWNQTLQDTVQDWASILGRIDSLTLPTDLQLELLRLRCQAAGVDRAAPA
jgi:hypothetical protein